MLKHKILRQWCPIAMYAEALGADELTNLLCRGSEEIQADLGNSRLQEGPSSAGQGASGKPGHCDLLNGGHNQFPQFLPRDPSNPGDGYFDPHVRQPGECTILSKPRHLLIFAL